MNIRNLNRWVLLVGFFALGACTSTPSERPILSAAQIESSIRVEVTVIEPSPYEETVAALAD